MKDISTKLNYDITSGIDVQDYNKLFAEEVNSIASEIENTIVNAGILLDENSNTQLLTAINQKIDEKIDYAISNVVNISEIQQELTTLATLGESQATKISSLTTSTDSNSSNLTLLNTNVGTLSGLVGAQASEITNLGTLTATHGVSITGIQTDLGVLQTESTTTTSNLALAQNAISTLTTKTDAQAIDITELISETEQNVVNITTLNGDMNNLDSDLADLANDVSGLTLTTETLTTNVANATSELTTLTNENSARASEITNLESRTDTIETTTARHENDLDMIQASVISHTTSIADVVDEVSTLTTESGSQATQLTELSARTTTVETDLEGIETVANQAHTDVITLNQAITDKDGGAWAEAGTFVTTDVNGEKAISGWKAISEDGTGSDFQIYSDTFKVTNGAQTYEPFIIDEDGIKFNGAVTFSGSDGDFSEYATKVYASQAGLNAEESAKQYAYWKANEVKNEVLSYSYWKDDKSKEETAQLLGFDNHDAMIDFASQGKTIIDGGYLNTNLIVTNAIAITGLQGYSTLDDSVTNRANSARDEAVSTSAIDATNKANNAETNAKQYSYWKANDVKNEMMSYTFWKDDENKEETAQLLGFDDFSQMVDMATGGQTIINGGYINTDLIQTGAISISGFSGYSGLTSSITSAKNDAISTASADATNKANSAKSEAIANIDSRYTPTSGLKALAFEDLVGSAMMDDTMIVNGFINTSLIKTDAISISGLSGYTTLDNSITTRANTAKTDAISTASSDATNKANSAETNAKGYTDIREGVINSKITTDVDSKTNQMATYFGYDSYQDLYDASVANETLIVGGYINTTLFEAHAITADYIDATNLVVSSANISGTLSIGNIPSNAINSNTTASDIGYTGAMNANYITNTNQLTDGAGLGTTATWSLIGNRPSDIQLLNSNTTPADIGYTGDLNATRNTGALADKDSVDLSSAEVTNKSLANVDSIASTKLGTIATNADVTSSNTSADTAKVSGVESATVKDNAQVGKNLTLSNTTQIHPSSVGETSLDNIKNTSVSISSNGVLNGAGGGQVTVAGIGAETPANAQTKADTARDDARDNLAVKLGYSTYSQMASSASLNGGLLATGGYLNTNLIEVEALVAKFIGVNQLTATNIDTDTLTIGGTQITPGSISGDRLITKTLTADHIDVDSLNVTKINEPGDDFYITADGDVIGATIKGASIYDINTAGKERNTSVDYLWIWPYSSSGSTQTYTRLSYIFNAPIASYNSASTNKVRCNNANPIFRFNMSSIAVPYNLKDNGELPDITCILRLTVGDKSYNQMTYISQFNNTWIYNYSMPANTSKGLFNEVSFSTPFHFSERTQELMIDVNNMYFWLDGYTGNTEKIQVEVVVTCNSTYTNGGITLNCVSTADYGETTFRGLPQQKAQGHIELVGHR